MANYFYYDRNLNKKQGPVSREQLQELVVQGVIEPRTPVGTDTGHKGIARDIPGLNFETTPTSTGFFDIGFTRFITNTWTSILWVLSIGTSFLGCGVAILFAIGNGVYILLFIAPIATALFLLFMRMSFEITIVLFRIETHLRTIRDKYENK